MSEWYSKYGSRLRQKIDIRPDMLLPININLALALQLSKRRSLPRYNTNTQYTSSSQYCEIEGSLEAVGAFAILL